MLSWASGKHQAMWTGQHQAMQQQCGEVGEESACDCQSVSDDWVGCVEVAPGSGDEVGRMTGSGGKWGPCRRGTSFCRQEGPRRPLERVALSRALL